MRATVSVPCDLRDVCLGLMSSWNQCLQSKTISGQWTEFGKYVSINGPVPSLPYKNKSWQIKMKKRFWLRPVYLTDGRRPILCWPTTNTATQYLFFFKPPGFISRISLPEYSARFRLHSKSTGSWNLYIWEFNEAFSLTFLEFEQRCSVNRRNHKNGDNLSCESIRRRERNSGPQ